MGNPDHATRGDRDCNAIRRPRRRADRCRPTISVERITQSGDDRRPRHDPARSPVTVFSTDASLPPGSAPRAVTVARTTAIPACTSFVDAAVAGRGDGTAQRPHKTIAAAVAAARNGAVICVAEGTYAEQLKPGEKNFTLAGGFQRGKDFKVRDSAAYVTKATGRGGLLHSHRGSRPQGRPAHGDRRLRHQRLFAGDLSATSTSRSGSTSRTTIFTTTDARTTRSPAPDLPSTTSRAGSKAMCSGTIPAAAAARASSTTPRTRTRSRSSATSSTTTPGRSRTARTAAPSMSSARRSGSPRTCSRETP